MNLQLYDRNGKALGGQMTTILILGAAVWANGPSPTLARRTAHAAQVWKVYPSARIVPCGGRGKHPPSEAAAMRTLLIDAGVPPEAITLEDQSTTTLENIRNGARVGGTGPYIIVTDLYHARRALMVARHFRLEAQVACPSTAQGQMKHLIREQLACISYAVKLRRMPRDLDSDH